MIKLVIPGRLPGLNQYTNQTRKNRFAGAQMKKVAQRTIHAAIDNQLEEAEPIKKAFIRFVWVEPNKRRDRDNIVFAKKFILDTLVKAKVIEGDAWKNIEGFSDELQVDKDNPRIEVYIIPEEKGE